MLADLLDMRRINSSSPPPPLCPLYPFVSVFTLRYLKKKSVTSCVHTTGSKFQQLFQTLILSDSCCALGLSLIHI